MSQLAFVLWWYAFHLALSPDPLSRYIVGEIFADNIRVLANAADGHGCVCTYEALMDEEQFKVLWKREDTK